MVTMVVSAAELSLEDGRNVGLARPGSRVAHQEPSQRAQPDRAGQHGKAVAQPGSLAVACDTAFVHGAGAFLYGSIDGEAESGRAFHDGVGLPFQSFNGAQHLGTTVGAVGGGVGQVLVEGIRYVVSHAHGDPGFVGQPVG